MNTGNIVTGEENFYMLFTNGTKKKGTEEIQFTLNPNNKEIKQGTLKDGETFLEILDFTGTAKIGTTLIKFLNKSDKIKSTLIKYFKFIENFKIEELHKKIETLISDFHINKFEPNQIMDICYKIYHNVSKIDALQLCNELIEILVNLDDYASKSPKDINGLKFLATIYSCDDDFGNDLEKEDLLQILQFSKNIFSLKNNYYEFGDVLTILELILEGRTDELVTNYKLILFNIIHTLEYRLEKIVKDKSLFLLIHQVFKKYFDDYNKFNISSSLYDLTKTFRNNVENNPYNTYYNTFYSYLLNLQEEKQNRDIERKRNGLPIEKVDTVSTFKNIIYKMTEIFVKTLRDDIFFMHLNYEEDISIKSANIIIEENTYKIAISSLNELFYYSKHYINEDGRKLKSCKLCGKYFVTEYKTDEVNCRNIYKKSGKTCSKTARYNSRIGNTIDKKINRKLKKIRQMLSNRDATHGTDESRTFNNKWKNKKDELEATEELKADKNKLFQAELKWLEEEHSLLKHRKNTPS